MDLSLRRKRGLLIRTRGGNSLLVGDCLFIECGAKDGDKEVREVSGVFIHLEPANDAVVF